MYRNPKQIRWVIEDNIEALRRSYFQEISANSVLFLHDGSEITGIILGSKEKRILEQIKTEEERLRRFEGEIDPEDVKKRIENITQQFSSKFKRLGELSSKISTLQLKQGKTPEIFDLQREKEAIALRIFQLQGWENYNKQLLENPSIPLSS